ncbi:hypothetical protein POM88_029908 [Heracleum sosnowskyi]|uniref:Transcription factor IIIB 90 kDa subunit n=1 Tax=Heracleum sosnowskyi TaxID=360622 RepID=A0AAD8HUZ1_9APIA|nr:hypothetical protein POM88_029908 [Heracleum sosnowskyi]
MNPNPSPTLSNKSQSHSVLDKKDFYIRSNQHSLNFIDNLALKLSIFDAFAVQQARKFYQTAGERETKTCNFSNKIAACCLYIACLLNKIPVLLFRFSVELGVNVYELGVEYLRICRVLGFDLNSFVQNVVDPSLFIHRYVTVLLKGRNLRVIMVALRIVEGVKGDLMQRNVGGVCGAAVYIAALANGFTCQKSDVERVVRVCDGVLRARLIEFGKTGSGGLTVDEFSRIAYEFEEDKDLELRDFGGDLDVLCRHNDQEAYCYGLCNVCYKEFVELCKGLGCGSNTRAFDRAKTERLIQGCINHDFGFSKKFSSVSSSVSDESEDLSDVEVDEYLDGEKEAEGKKVLWEVMNKEYIREQDLKKTAAATGEVKKKPRKKQMEKRGTKVDNATAPASAEATQQTSNKKRLNSLINFDALNELFEDDAAAPNGKKTRTEFTHDTDAWDQEAVGEETVGGDSGDEDYEQVEEYNSDCDFF